MHNYYNEFHEWNEKRTQEKRDRRAQRYQEDLFLLLDDNYEKYFDDIHCWRTLQGLDKEIVQGGIRIDDVHACGAHDLRERVSSKDHFMRGEKTVVVELKHREATLEAARVLNKIFQGCGTNFVPEVEVRDGKEHFQLRSNMDKQHWDKLCVFSHYRFNREVTDPQEREKFYVAIQEKTSEYVKAATGKDNWYSLEGVPAFIGLMGLHGVLRPEGHRKIDAKRAESEFAFPHPRGTPFIFDGVRVHVEMKSQTIDGVTMTPYSYGFDVDRAAMNDATDGKAYWELLLETLGGNPFAKKDGPTMRAIHGVTNGFVAYGLYKGTEDMIGWVGPVATIGAAGMFVIATYADHKWKIIKRINGIKRGSEEHIKAMEEAGMSPEIIAGELEKVQEEAAAEGKERPELSDKIKDILAKGSGFCKPATIQEGMLTRFNNACIA